MSSARAVERVGSSKKALLASARRASSHKHLTSGAAPASSSSSSSRGDVNSSKTKPASAAHSRASARFSATYLYFLVLEGSWYLCFALASAAYAVAILLCGVVATGLDLVNVNDDLEDSRGHDPEQFELALRFASAHVVTMSAGNVVPVSTLGHFIAVAQQMLGVGVNLVVLSAIVAKFQSPRGDIVWSSVGVVRCRDGVPSLQFRVGNLRCNKLFPNEISLALLRRHVTREGETFSKRVALNVARPSVISGVHTVVHDVDETSPLLPVLRSGALRRAFGKDGDGDGGRMLLHATLRAFDDVFKGDVCATASYGEGSVVFGGKFEDVISVDERSGAPKIAWERFNAARECDRAGRVDGTDVVDVDVDVDVDDVEEGEYAMEGDAAPTTTPTPGCPRLTCGCARASYGERGGLDNGAPRSPLVPYCPYSSRIGLLLAEGGVDWELVRIDYVKGARGWYKRAYAPADAPAMQGTPGGDRDDLDAWVGGSAVCKANAILADGDVARRAVVKSKTSEDAVAKMAEPLIFGGLAPRMLGTREPRGRKILAFMLKKTLGEEEVKTMALTDDDGAKPDVNADDVREACRTAVRKAISRCVTVLVACEARGDGGFLAPGSDPDPCDFILAGAVHTAKSLLESGLADVSPGGPYGFSAYSNGKVIERYLRRWCVRPSWTKTYGLNESTVCAAIVRSFAAKISGAAGDVCPPEKLRGACNRARRLDARYREFIASRDPEGGGRDPEGGGSDRREDAAGGDAGGFLSASICI